MRRQTFRFTSFIAASVLSLSAMLCGTAQASGSDAMQSLINNERSSRGLVSLSFDSGVYGIAAQHSQEMADAGRIFHNDNLPNEVNGWTLLGENVGRGPSIDSVHTAFMNSAVHRSQILDPGYRAVATGVASSGGDLYVTEIFITRSGSAAPRTPRVRVASASSDHVAPPPAPVPAPVVAAAAPPPPPPVVKIESWQVSDSGFKIVVPATKPAIDRPHPRAVRVTHGRLAVIGLVCFLFAACGQLAYLISLQRKGWKTLHPAGSIKVVPAAA